MQNLLGLKVKDAYRLNDEDPIVVRLNDEFGKVVDSFVHHAELSGRWSHGARDASRR